MVLFILDLVWFGSIGTFRFGLVEQILSTLVDLTTFNPPFSCVVVYGRIVR